MRHMCNSSIELNPIWVWLIITIILFTVSKCTVSKITEFYGKLREHVRNFLAIYLRIGYQHFVVSTNSVGTLVLVPNTLRLGAFPNIFTKYNMKECLRGGSKICSEGRYGVHIKYWGHHSSLCQILLRRKIVTCWHFLQNIQKLYIWVLQNLNPRRSRSFGWSMGA